MRSEIYRIKIQPFIANTHHFVERARQTDNVGEEVAAPSSRSVLTGHHDPRLQVLVVLLLRRRQQMFFKHTAHQLHFLQRRDRLEGQSPEARLEQRPCLLHVVVDDGLMG